MIETKTNSDSSDQTLTNVDNKTETNVEKETSPSASSADSTKTNVSDQQQLDQSDAASSNKINHQNKEQSDQVKKVIQDDEISNKVSMNPPIRRFLTVARKSTNPMTPSKIMKLSHGCINKPSADDKKDDSESSEDDEDFEEDDDDEDDEEDEDEEDDDDEDEEDKDENEDDNKEKKVEGPSVVTEKAVVYGKDATGLMAQDFKQTARKSIGGFARKHPNPWKK